ncbi:thiamine pyrophosphate-dependent enzyme [Devosia sp.]|uniref:thiamine pyrophosphate-dependent enzyme n=1 Tax=Devosia sp. TaxID=1871048 RepID=UPI0035ADF0EB
MTDAATPSPTALMDRRAAAIAAAGGLEAAIASGPLAEPLEVSLSEALVLGLMRQGVRKFFAIFGHGSTALAEVLRVYEAHGLVRVWQFRNEIEMAHAGTALRWTYGETCAVITSIGPGALQAMSASLAAASNGIGVYHIYGDETTHGEGYNMQQVPKPAQGLYGQITALMGRSYTLHTPEALREALRQGAATVFHPTRAGPFYLLTPINTQPRIITLNIAGLPRAATLPAQVPADHAPFAAAADLIAAFGKVAIKAGGGARRFPEQVRRLAELAGAAVLLSPGSTGLLPDNHPQNLHVAGSKGSISGNFGMDEAELLIVIGSRAVCQADCSGIGYPRVRQVININADINDIQHYNNTLPLLGDIGAILDRLNALLADRDLAAAADKQAWLAACRAAKGRWRSFKEARFAARPLHDPAWQRTVLTQPVAIRTVAEFAKRIDALKYFDAGDVQANGFQIVEDDTPTETVTESGASYMGFAVSALLAGAAAERPRYAIAFTGDGSFMMNPQVLIDGVAHGAKGMIVLFDNRRMAAISGLQLAQYGIEYRTNDNVVVDYRQLAAAVSGVAAFWGGTTREELAGVLERARAHDGLSLVHVPVYHGTDVDGGMGAYGRWNVGNWVADVERDYALTAI